MCVQSVTRQCEVYTLQQYMPSCSQCFWSNAFHVRHILNPENELHQVLWYLIIDRPSNRAAQMSKCNESKSDTNSVYKGNLLSTHAWCTWLLLQQRCSTDIIHLPHHIWSFIGDIFEKTSKHDNRTCWLVKRPLCRPISRNGGGCTHDKHLGLLLYAAAQFHPESP